MTKDKPPINWRKVGRLFLALVVGSIAAIQSYDHQRELAHSHGQYGFIGSLFPISVDVLILYATFSMDGRNRFWPRLTFWAGVSVTISANVLAAPHDLLSQLLSAWAPIALLLVIENEAWRNKLSRVRFGKIRPAVEPVAVPEMPSIPEPLAEVSDIPEPAADAKPRTPNSRGVAARQKVAKVAKKLPEAKPAVIAAKAGVSESTARRYMPPVPASQPAVADPVSA